MACLGEVDLFSLCSKRELRRVAALADVVEFDAGSVLLEEGSAGAAEAFVIVSGDVDVSLRGRRIGAVGPSGVVGEMALLTRGPRAATVRARTPVTAYVIGAREFATLLADVPEVGRKILQTLARRLRDVVPVDEDL